jgi:hypothetical protein
MSFKITTDTSFLKDSVNTIYNIITPQSIPIALIPTNEKILNLEKTLPVINLSQSNFITGTYRIKSRGYYKLTENIIFNPNPSTWSVSTLVGDDWNPTTEQTTGGPNAKYPIQPYGPYHLGFFAAITIESDEVIIDLNSFMLCQSMEHYLQQRFFSLIELSSSPFISGQGPSNFGSPVFSPKYVKIKNGILGRSSHQSIHGNGMKHIIIDNISLNNYEQAGIQMNGGEYIILKNINIDRNSHDTLVNAKYSQSRFIRTFIQSIITATDPSITILGVSKSGTDILNELNTEMNTVYKDVIVDKIMPTSSLYVNNSRVIDGGMYGIVLNVMGVAVNKFLSHLNGTTGNKHILLQNINISNLTAFPSEIVGLSIDNPNHSKYGLPVQKGPVGDVFDIIGVTTPGNTFYNQNVFANAQCYVSKYKSLISGGGTSSINPTIYNEWIASSTALAPFITENYYVCGGDSMSHVMKGVIGLFLSGTQNTECYDINIKGINNIGNLGEVTLCQPGVPVYDGNRCRGLVFASCKDTKIANLNISDLSSTTSDSIAVDFIGVNNNIIINKYIINNIIQANYLDSGAYPNVTPNCIIFNNKDSVSSLTLSPKLT